MLAIVILICFSAGCIDQQPGTTVNNTIPLTTIPTVSPTVTSVTTVSLSAIGTVALSVQPTQQPTTIPAAATTPEPVATAIATVTAKPLSTPTVSMIHVNDPAYHVEPISFDTGGTITSGNIDLSGTIESSYGSPLLVVMRADFVSAYGNVTKATVYDTVKMYPYGTSEYTFRVNGYVFNDRPDYAVTHDTYDITVVNVSVAA
ncbi:MAG: hypothetical protein LUQ31_05995 [Methanoregula sp.]|nr:hypothetical protein [Methanoregula sp.]